ncbi:MAG: hypothetical protein ACKVS8_07090 [Phycisphaerales bacterium]
MMDMLLSLWLPILLAAVAAWFWSFLSWAILPIHKNDMKGLPNEDAALAKIRELGLAPGNYAFPHCDGHKNKNDPAFQAKWKAGPAGMLNVWPANISMGMCMALSFMVNLLASVLIAYLLVAAGVPKGAAFVKVMQVAGTAGVLAYTIGWMPGSIWFQASTNQKVAMLFDGLVVGLGTGAIFAALWPKLAVAGAAITLPG